jgi:hypothetical protein
MAVAIRKGREKEVRHATADCHLPPNLVERHILYLTNSPNLAPDQNLPSYRLYANLCALKTASSASKYNIYVRYVPLHRIAFVRKEYLS